MKTPPQDWSVSPIVPPRMEVGTMFNFFDEDEAGCLLFSQFKDAWKAAKRKPTALPAMDGGIDVGSFHEMFSIPRADGKELRVSQFLFQGLKYMDFRLYEIQNGEMLPTLTGVTISEFLIPMLIQAMNPNNQNEKTT